MKKVILIFLLLFSVNLLFADDQKIITILDFETSGVSMQEMALFVDYLSSSVSDYEGYIVIDRRQREIILAEAEFSNSGCADESCALEIGQLLSANEMIVGSLGSIGSRFLLNIKLIDIQTGKVANDVSGKYSSIDELVDGSGMIIHELFTGEEVKQNTIVADSSSTVDIASGADIRLSGIGLIEYYEAKGLFGDSYYEYSGVSYKKDKRNGYLQLVNVIDAVFDQQKDKDPAFPESLNQQILDYRKKVTISKIGWWSSLGLFAGSSVLGALAFTEVISSSDDYFNINEDVGTFIINPKTLIAGLLFWGGIAGMVLFDGMANEPKELVSGFNSYYR